MYKYIQKEWHKTEKMPFNTSESKYIVHISLFSFFFFNFYLPMNLMIIEISSKWLYKLLKNIMLTCTFVNIDVIGTLSIRNILAVESKYLTWYKKMLIEIAVYSLAVVWKINLPLFLK